MKFLGFLIASQTQTMALALARDKVRRVMKEGAKMFYLLPSGYYEGISQVVRPFKLSFQVPSTSTANRETKTNLSLSLGL